jgi:hypothetical protein
MIEKFPSDSGNVTRESKIVPFPEGKKKASEDTTSSSPSLPGKVREVADLLESGMPKTDLKKRRVSVESTTSMPSHVSRVARFLRSFLPNN